MGGTSISPPYVDCSILAGCLPVTGAIDSFLPPTYPASLRSQAHSIDLRPQFQDFEYPIDSSLKSVTFAFASTDYPEMIGIDSVRIMGDSIGPVFVPIDIKPGSDPNSINLGSKGVVPVAVLYTEDFDPSTIDPSTVKFAGAPPVKWTIEDVDGDGDLDMLFHFDTQILAELAELNEDSTEATLTGNTTDGWPIEGTDTVNIVPKGKRKEK